MSGEPITNLDELISLATSGGTGAREMVPFQKRGVYTAGGAVNIWNLGQFASFWQYTGQPSAGGQPTTSVVCTNATSGALPITTSAAGTQKYLLALQVILTLGGSSTSGVVVLYDRLCHSGGLSGTSTSAQTTNLPTAALTRRTSGLGVEMWIELYSSVGATTQTTLTASYTNDAGTSGHTTNTAPIGGGSGHNQASRFILPPLASGDRGARAVASVTLAASTGSAGNFGVVLAFPIISLPAAAAAVLAQHQSLFSMSDGPLGLGVASNACLALAVLPTSAATAELMGACWLAEK